MTGYRRRRDLTIKQFETSIAEHGFKRVGFMGYYDIGDGVSVSVLNAGLNASNRTKLAYLLDARAKLDAKKGE